MVDAEKNGIIAPKHLVFTCRNKIGMDGYLNNALSFK